MIRAKELLEKYIPYIEEHYGNIWASEFGWPPFPLEVVIRLEMTLNNQFGGFENGLEGLAILDFLIREGVDFNQSTPDFESPLNYLKKVAYSGTTPPSRLPSTILIEYIEQMKTGVISETLYEELKSGLTRYSRV